MNFERNNRESIHRLSPRGTFWDLCELYETLYLCNDALNVVQIKEGDLLKFNLYMDGEIKKIYGMCSEIMNFNQTTFMICSHVDQNGDEFFLDYVYSSFLHAFVRLNHSGLFKEWNILTFAKDAKCPDWFSEYWIANKAPNVTAAPQGWRNENSKSTETPKTVIKEDMKVTFDQLVENYVELECQLEKFKEVLTKYSMNKRDELV